MFGTSSQFSLSLVESFHIRLSQLKVLFAYQDQKFILINQKIFQNLTHIVIQQVNFLFSFIYHKNYHQIHKYWQTPESYPKKDFFEPKLN